jgi:hypothetical protein
LTKTGRLYLETNYLLSRATGRTHNAREIFISRPAHIDIAIPSHAITEAKIALKSMANAKRNLIRPFDTEITDIGRDEAPHAKSVVAALTGAALKLQQARR